MHALTESIVFSLWIDDIDIACREQAAGNRLKKETFARARLGKDDEVRILQLTAIKWIENDQAAILVNTKHYSAIHTNIAAGKREEGGGGAGTEQSSPAELILTIGEATEKACMVLPVRR